jgi:hypothetical protein
MLILRPTKTHAVGNSKTIKTALPLRLQAYERLTLLMERINPSQLVSRVNPISDDKMIIKTLLLKSRIRT